MTSQHFSVQEQPMVSGRASDKTAQFQRSSMAQAVLIVATGMGLVACGGGGSGTAPASSPVTLSGQAVKGPVIGGQVCAYTLNSPRQQIACSTTDSNAKYSLALPEGTGEVLLEVTGGTYVDEATGKTVALSDPLRTISKAGDAYNALITPFTELAVQRASVSNPGGNLSLVGFQTQIGNLEVGLGFTGLANGNPFVGKSEADQKYAEALTAFAKLQNGQGKNVAGALQIMGSELDKCGISSLGVSLAVYGAVGQSTSSSSSGSVMIKAAQVLSPLSSASGLTNDLNLSAYRLELGAEPSSCSNSFVLDGSPQAFSDLFGSAKSAWATAKSVEIISCNSAEEGMNGIFPQALVKVSANLNTNIGNISLSGNGGGVLLSGSTTVSSISGNLNIQGKIDDPLSNVSGVTVLTPAGIVSQNGAINIMGTGGSSGGAIPIGSLPTSTLVLGTNAEVSINALSNLSVTSGGGSISIRAPSLNWQTPGADPIDLAASGLTFVNGCLAPSSSKEVNFSNLSIVRQNQSGIVLNANAGGIFHQTTSRVILNWSTFNIGSNGSVTFNQPSGSSVQLNQVTLGAGNTIYGTLVSNGSAVVLNSNGSSIGPVGGGTIVLVNNK